ncbi:MAG: hypothetical protein Q8N03_07875 [Ignavibacteria bacterium]|nr:hypothetical protein [Ignavibacteria bacterium]
MKKIIIVIFMSTIILNAQQNENTFLLNIKTGLTFSGFPAYRFKLASTRSNSNLHTMYPGYLFGIGIEEENIINFYTAHIGLSFELNYGKSTTGWVNFSNEDIKFETTSLPILLWMTFKTDGQIVPFLKIGVGAENSTFGETLKNHVENSFKLEKWFFVWGIGAGIDFNIFDSIRLSIFIDNVATESWFNTKLDNGIIIDYGTRYGVILCGIQFGYKL